MSTFSSIWLIFIRSMQMDWLTHPYHRDTLFTKKKVIVIYSPPWGWTVYLRPMKGLQISYGFHSPTSHIVFYFPEQFESLMNPRKLHIPCIFKLSRCFMYFQLSVMYFRRGCRLSSRRLHGSIFDWSVWASIPLYHIITIINLILCLFGLY